MPASTTLTASQQEWQSRYQALKAQQECRICQPSPAINLSLGAN